jgi:hypothetical protein
VKVAAIGAIAVADHVDAGPPVTTGPVARATPTRSMEAAKPDSALEAPEKVNVVGISSLPRMVSDTTGTVTGVSV